MPEYLSPGVYVEEVPSSIKPIVGVSTSTAAFLGVVPNTFKIPEANPGFNPSKKVSAENPKFVAWNFPYPQADLDQARADYDAVVEPGVRPPRPKIDQLGDKPTPEALQKVHGQLKTFREKRDGYALASRRIAASDLAEEAEPILCTSFAQFRLHFGDFSDSQDQRNLVHGVFGFFNNGGTRCYVMRYPTLSGLQAPEALAPLEAITEISMVAAPGILDEVVQSSLIAHCENLHDRVAILDAPSSPKQFTEDELKVVSNTDYGALYFPRIKVFDIVRKLMAAEDEDDSDGEVYVSPSGHIAGVYARVDHTRGVHKAPANEPIHGALPKGVEHLISKAIQDGLNPAGINCIRNINGKVNVWGARTIGGDLNGDVKYISVRRTLIFLERSIDEGTQWVVFEPNDRSLWAKIVRNVSEFLTDVWRDGALFGSTPKEAFYVRCDDETNPFSERELGKVTTEIGVAIVRPAEFVIFRIQQWAGPEKQ